MPTTPQQTALRAQLIEVIPGLRARALKLCLNRAEAQDLVQDTIERALRFEATYAPGTNLRAWTHQILFSVFASSCRREQRQRRALHALTHDPCAAVMGDGVKAVRSLSPKIERALAGLPPQFAAVIRLVDLNDYAYKDAAAALGVPLGTVMSRLFRARKLLAAALGDEHTAAPALKAA